MKRREFLALSAAASATSASVAAPTTDVPLVSFGLITDVQYADTEPAGERHYRESASTRHRGLRPVTRRETLEKLSDTLEKCASREHR